MTNLNHQRGFTLVELIMVIVVMGIIAGMVSVFMKSPIDAYVASGRRAALTDVADTVVRRMARDIQRALPNSISTSDDYKCIEFIPTKTGGRYRTEEVLASDDKSLNFSANDSMFHMLGRHKNYLNGDALPEDQIIKDGDVIAVYNLGLPDANPFQTDPTKNNTAVVMGDPSEEDTPPETKLTISSKRFPLASGSNRFHVIPKNENVVAYVCSGSNLYRIATNTLVHICPASGSATVPSNTPILARNVTYAGCNFDYNNSVDLHRNALISMRLQLTDDSGESVTLQHEVHVSNTP